MHQLPTRLAWLATHPIQYQAPLFRAIAACADIKLTVLFFSDFSTRRYLDAEFGEDIAWDTELLSGYSYEFLPGNGNKTTGIKTFQPRVNGLANRLNRENFDAVVVQGWNHYGMVMAAWLAKRAGIQVLMRCEATDHVDSSRGIKGILREAIVRFQLRQVDNFMAIGTHNRNFYLSRGVLSDQIGSMPYCVDNDHFRLNAENANTETLRSELGLNQIKPIILYVGKFTARKFPDHLLEAYYKLPAPRPYLIYVGNGELRANLEEIVQKYELEDVRFAGFRNQSQLPAFYALADIFVLPSVNETWGLVVNEAMNAGCAIITSDCVGSAADLLHEGQNGFKFTAYDLQSLENALRECLANKRYIEMGGASLKIINDWSIAKNINGLRLSLRSSCTV